MRENLSCAKFFNLYKFLKIKWPFIKNSLTQSENLNNKSHSIVFIVLVTSMLLPFHLIYSIFEGFIQNK